MGSGEQATLTFSLSPPTLRKCDRQPIEGLARVQNLPLRAPKNSGLWRKAQWDKGEQGGRDVLSLGPASDTGQVLYTLFTL